MKTRSRLCLLFAITLTVAGTVIFAHAQSQLELPPINKETGTLSLKPLTLTVVTGQGTIKKAPGFAQFQMGTVEETQIEPVTHVFLVRNDTSVPVTITHLMQTGFTMTAQIGETEQDARPLPTTLEPNDVLPITVSLDISEYRLSSEHTVFVMIAGQNRPAASLEMIGTIHSPIQFSQNVLDFGKFPLGQKNTRALTVTLAPEVRFQMGIADSLKLVSLSRDFGVTLVTAVPPQKPSKSGRIEPNFGGNNYTPEEIKKQPPSVLTYRITVNSKKRFGHLTSQVEMILPGLPALTIVQGATVSVVADVRGPITASPEALNFRNMQPGRTSRQSIELQASGSRSLRHLKVTSEQKYVTARFRDTKGEAATKRLEVTIGPKSPPGVTQTFLDVTLASGQVLVIPINLLQKTSPEPLYSVP